MAWEEEIEIQEEPAGLLELRRWVGKYSETQVVRVYRTEYQRGDNFTEKRLQRSVGAFTQGNSTVLTCTCTWRNDLRPEKNCPKSLKGTVPSTHTGLGTLEVVPELTDGLFIFLNSFFFSF